MRMATSRIGMALQHLCQRTISRPQACNCGGVTGRNFAISNFYKLVSLLLFYLSSLLVVWVEVLRLCGT